MQQNPITDEAEVEKKDSEITEEEIEEIINDEDEEDSEDDSEDDTDWKAIALKNKAIAKRFANKIRKSKEQSKTVEDIPQPKKKAAPITGLTQEEIDARIEERIAQRDLESLEVSTEVRNEIKKYARLNNVSITEAAKSDYIAFIKNKESERNRIEEATISSKRKSAPRTDFSDAKPSDFDQSTKEGREQFSAYKDWLKKQ